MPFRRLLDDFPGKAVAGFQQTVHRLVHPVEMAGGPGAGGGGAFRFLQTADFFLGGEDEGFQAHSPLAHQGKGVPGGLAGHRLGGQVEDAVCQPFPHGLYRREQGGNRFSHAGGGLAEQAAFVPQGAVHGRGQPPLPRPVLGEGKGKALQALLPRLPPVSAETGPGGEPLHQIPVEGGQLLPGKFPLEPPELLRFRLAIGKAHRNRRSPVGGAVEVGVAHGLGPVHRMPALGQGVQRNRHRLDLVYQNAGFRLQQAVGPAFHRAADAVPFLPVGKGHLGPVALAPFLLQPAVDARPLGGPVLQAARPGAAVQIAGTEEELHQPAHRNPYLKHGSASFFPSLAVPCYYSTKKALLPEKKFSRPAVVFSL